MLRLKIVIKSVWLLICFYLLVSCTTKLSKEGGLVKLSYESPQKECKQLDFVHYSYGKGKAFSCDYDSAKNTLRNEAADIGANYVKLGDIKDDGFYCNATGEAYKCP